MAFYYVKNGGTATGDAGRAAAARTGSFATMGASAYYDSIQDVFLNTVPTTAPVAGDIVCVSSAHSKAYTALTNLGLTDNAYLMSVDDANAENYLKGAKESNSGSATAVHFYLNQSITNRAYTSKGITYESKDDLFLSSKENVRTDLYDCSLILIGIQTGDNIGFSTADGSFANLIDVDLTYGHTAQGIESTSGFSWSGGSVTSTQNHLVTSAGNSPCVFKLSNLDITNINDSLIEDSGNIAVMDNLEVQLNRSILASGTTLLEINYAGHNPKFIARSIGFGISDDTYHYFEEICYGGSVVENTSIYRDAGASYGAIGFSAEFETLSTMDRTTPLIHNLANFSIDTADYTTDVTFKVHLAKNDILDLTDNEISIHVTYIDGASNALGGTTNTALTDVVGVSIPTETEAWTGLTGTVDVNHEMLVITSDPITIGTAAGNIASGLVSVSVQFSDASRTIYVCSKVEVV